MVKNLCSWFSLLLFFILIESGIVSAQHLPSPDTVAYRKAFQIESLRIFGTSRQQYRQIVDAFLKKYEKTSVATDSMVADLPTALAATFRLAVVTARNNISTQRSLTYQLESYEDTQTLLDNMLALVLSLRRQDQVSRIAYETLFFARAYNRLAWAYQLSVATPWKQYVVLPFSQISPMLQLVGQDLEQSLLFQELPIPGIGEREKEAVFQLYLERLTQRLSLLPRDSIEYRTYQLLNQEESPERLAQVIAKRSFYQTLWTWDALQSVRVAESLSRMSRIHDYAGTQGKEAEAIFAALEVLAQKIGLKTP